MNEFKKADVKKFIVMTIIFWVASFAGAMIIALKGNEDVLTSIILSLLLMYIVGAIPYALVKTKFAVKPNPNRSADFQKGWKMGSFIFMYIVSLITYVIRFVQRCGMLRIPDDSEYWNIR